MCKFQDPEHHEREMDISRLPNGQLADLLAFEAQHAPGQPQNPQRIPYERGRPQPPPGVATDGPRPGTIAPGFARNTHGQFYETSGTVSEVLRLYWMIMVEPIDQLFIGFRSATYEDLSTWAASRGPRAVPPIRGQARGFWLNPAAGGVLMIGEGRVTSVEDNTVTLVQ
ncbi:hypothetical protein BDW59DRAFT_160842 [Aspergillus cavernicola]|uniref:Uncharacterized protein n=1 Tax=Aspergillus cavernicola TaxID=176166 RepID=A0ABR4IFV8_9EURO